MKPFRPLVLKFESADGAQRLAIPLPPKPAELQWHGQSYSWRDLPQPHPGEVVFADVVQYVILLGGLGDSGSSLGQIYVHALDGQVLAALDAHQPIPQLEQLSRAWTLFPNFPWIAAWRLERDGRQLAIWVCEQVKLCLDLVDYTMTTAPSTAAEDWADSTLVGRRD